MNLKTKLIILVLLQIFLFDYLFSQDKILYHHISRTPSSWNIVEWNIKQVQDKKWLLEEYVDEKGRVVELCFYKEGSLNYRHQCYLANRVTFEYEENKIIETLYLNNNPIFWNDCGKNHKSIYYLDKEGYIEKVDYVYEFNSNKKSEYTINDFKPIKIITPEDRQLLSLSVL